MNRFFSTAAAVAITAGSVGLASAQTNNDQMQNRQSQAADASRCVIVDRNFETQLRDDPNLRAGYTNTLIQDVRQLRNAAQTLAAYGKDAACNEVAEALNELVSDPQQAQRMGTGGEPIGGWRDQPGAYTFESARGLDKVQSQLRADRVLGADVRSADDENIGEISDIVLAPDGRPAYAIVSYGGFLGLGQEQSAVPFDILRVSTDGEVFYLAMTEEQLDNAPRFERGSTDWMNESWRQRNDDYYDAISG